MRCVYNDVDLGILETHYFNWESVYDDTGTDYLYSKVSFACRALVNGISSVVIPLSNGPFINYRLAGDSASLSAGEVARRSGAPFVPGPIPSGTGVINAASTSRLRNIIPNPGGTGPNRTNDSHQAIRYRLSIPRRPLYVFWGNGPPANPAFLFLESPNPGSPCDCKNGPTPRLLSVVEALGDANTLMVDWACETYVNEAENNEVRQVKSLLSNRFSQSHAVGEDGYTTITTQGVAVFRTDNTFRLNESPDDARAVLFMPIPQGFTREILYVKGREDTTGVEYGYRDTQVSVNFVAGPYVKASKISILHQQTITTDIDVFGTALATYERAISIQAQQKFAKGESTMARPTVPTARPVSPPTRGVRPLPSAAPPRSGFGGTGRGIRRPGGPPP